ncbi:MAG: phosphopyruvate hydratase [Candidatus Doudnabacteria bacterium]|nr:phosphopyruvate hydratase [Candidatus Doudnabacteria bacterium]
MPRVPIKKVEARQILDSRGYPTLEVVVETAKGIGVFGVPSGASTGRAEAVELRDGGDKFFGLGVTKAIKNVNEIIGKKLKGTDVANQKKVDEMLLELDGALDKSNLGGNALIGVSGAVCKAAAASKGIEVYEYVASLRRNKKYKLPRPMFNVINGGVHGDTNLNIQEFMLVPSGQSFSENLETASEVFQALRKTLKLHRLDTDLGNEGGYSPNWESNEQPLRLIAEAVSQTRHASQMELALDAAANQFFNSRDKEYILNADHTALNAERMVSLYRHWAEKYPIISIEDGLNEDDWEGWSAMQKRLGDKIMLVGDDLFVTQAKRLKKGIELGVANAIIIKPNQVGTITETMNTVVLAQKNNYKIVCSHRSGETNDDFIADFAVGVGADFIKAGSVARGERVAKWNRLLKIEEELI